MTLAIFRTEGNFPVEKDIKNIPSLVLKILQEYSLDPMI